MLTLTQICNELEITAGFFMYLDVYCAMDFEYEIVNGKRLYDPKCIDEILCIDKNKYKREYKSLCHLCDDLGISFREYLISQDLDHINNNLSVTDLKVFMSHKINKIDDENYLLEIKKCNDCPTDIFQLDRNSLIEKMQHEFPKRKIETVEEIVLNSKGKKPRKKYVAPRIVVTKGDQIKNIQKSNLQYYTLRGWKIKYFQGIPQNKPNN